MYIGWQNMLNTFEESFKRATFSNLIMNHYNLIIINYSIIIYQVLSFNFSSTFINSNPSTGDIR